MTDQCECRACQAARRAHDSDNVSEGTSKDHNIIAPAAETIVRDYFKRASLLVEDLTDSEDIADLTQLDTFCAVALVAQMLQKEEQGTADRVVMGVDWGREYQAQGIEHVMRDLGGREYQAQGIEQERKK